MENCKTAKVKSLRKIIPGMTIIPMMAVVLLCGLMCFYMLRMYSRNTRVSNQNTLEFYRENIDNVLESTSSFLSNIVVKNNFYFSLLGGTTELAVFQASQGLVNIFESSSLEDDISFFFIYDEEKAVKREVYFEDFVSDVREKARRSEEISLLMEGKKQSPALQWTVYNLAGRNYLVQIYGQNGAFVGAGIDFQKLVFPMSETAVKQGYSLCFVDAEGRLVYSEREIGADQTELVRKQREGIAGFLTGSHMVLSQPLQTAAVSIAMLISYKALLGSIPGLLIVLLVLSVCMFFMIPVMFRMTRRYVVRPFDKLTAEVNMVRSEGDIESLAASINAGARDFHPEGDYESEEFQNIHGAITLMIGRVRDITTNYMAEKQLKEKTQLNYYQTQIRPHFFLNCLKNIYALAQQKKIEECKRLILELSEYFRYMFKDITMTVPLAEELSHIDTYIHILNDTSAVPVEFQKKAGQAILTYPIPPLTLHTFVENAVKHGRIPGRRLLITFHGMEIQMEDGNYLDLTVDNNGEPYTEEEIASLNREDDRMYQEGHVGIWNVRQQLRLLYGSRAQIAFYNSASGKPTIKILLPAGENNG